MVVTALFENLGREIDKLFNVIGGSGSGDGNGGLGLGSMLRNFLDGGSNSNGGNIGGGGGFMDTIKTVIQDSLTVENLNTVKGLLRDYWGNHTTDRNEVRENLDEIRMALSKEGMGEKSMMLARVINCVEYGEECDEDLDVARMNDEMITASDDPVTTTIAESFGLNAQVGGEQNNFISVLHIIEL